MTLESEKPEEPNEPMLGDPIVGENDEAQFTYKNYTAEQCEKRNQIRHAALRPFDWPKKDKFVISGMSGRFPGKRYFDNKKILYNIFLII